MILNLKDKLNIKRASLIRFERPESTEAAPLYFYYTDFGRDVTYNGLTYRCNTVQSIKNIKFTKELTAHKAKVEFSGLVQEQLDMLTDSNSSFLNKKVLISQIFLDPDTEEVINDEVIIFEGLITGSTSTDSVSRGKSSASITWEITNHFGDFNQVVSRTTDDENHRALQAINGEWQPSDSVTRPEYAFDKGFFHSNRTTSVMVKYMAEEQGFKMKKKKNWHGLSSSYSLVEVTNIVEKEVDIRFDLSAKAIPVVYGVQRVPGIPIFADTNSEDASEVWLVYAFCEGEIEGFFDIYLDDAPIVCFDDSDADARVCFGRKSVNGDTLNSSVASGTGGRAPSSVHGQSYVLDDGVLDAQFWTFHGLPNQTSPEMLVELASQNKFLLQNDLGYGTEYWDESFKLLDTAYIVFKFNLSAVDGGSATIPSIEAEVRGKKVITTNGGNIVSNNKTSTNMAWQILDYLTSPRYGLSLSMSEIDLFSFEDVAAKLDIIDDTYEADWVPYWRYIGWEDSVDSERAMVQTNCLLKTEDSIFKNVGSMLDQIGGSLNKFGGKYVLQVESDNESVLHIDLDLESLDGVTVKDLTGTSKFNTVTASITDPAKAWEANSVTFFNSDYKEEDRSVEKKLNLAFPYVTNYYTARSMSERELKKSRFSRSVTFQLPYYYLGSLLPNNNITISYKRYGWEYYRFLVTSVDIGVDGKLTISLEEFPDGVFINSPQADNSSNYETGVGSLSVLPARDLTYTPASALPNPDISVNGRLSWLPSITQEIDFYSVYWEGVSEPVKVSKPPASTGATRINLDITNLAPGSYVFSVRAVSINGFYSAPISLEATIDSGKYLPLVPNFNVSNLEPGYTNRFIGSFVYLTWDDIESNAPNVVFKLQILNTSNDVLREIILPRTTLAYTYTFAMNKSDYTAAYASVGASRELRFRIRAEDSTAISYDWSVIA